MKIVASDFDGTLYRNGTVSKEEIDAVLNWRKNGNIFGIITGRNYSSLREDLDKFDIEYDFIISTNGALIRDGKGEVLKSFEVDVNIAKELIDFVGEHNSIWAELMYMNSSHRRVIEHRTPDSELKINYDILNETKSFHQFSCTIFNYEEARAMTEFINEKYKGVLNAYCLIDSEKITANIDTVKYGVSKASALYEYGKLKNVSKENIITVGDNFNDIPMVKEFNGYIMSSALEEVRMLANKTCSSLCEIL